MSCNKAIEVTADKLGLKEETKLISKAAEFQRLLLTKAMAGSNISDAGKIVICLDLAAGILNIDFDVKKAVKYAGLRMTQYINYRNTIENLLDISSEKVNIATMCITLQCELQQSLAEAILSKYQRQSKQIMDLSLPQYICMAVYQACRLSKEKVSKSKLIAKSRLKPMQWAKLEADWTKFVKEHFANNSKLKGKHKDATNNNDDGMDDNENTVASMDVDDAPNNTEIQQIEPYENWKKRMLELAHQELKVLKMSEINEQIKSPRKSPRKTPQALPIYNNLKHGESVKLLFPKV